MPEQGVGTYEDFVGANDCNVGQDCIFKNDDAHKWNVKFYSKKHAKYAQICETRKEKGKTERSVMRNIAPVLSLFKICIKNGHKVGRRRPFFYIENYVFISVGQDKVSEGIANRYIMGNGEEERRVLNATTDMYRRRGAF